ncbi:hypothetical protein TNIN_277101 [Trichonephila inaurata madagascariensis]|uniref:Uncharacterized protein n=1 Tax=Trichonephila inaurata madagascariensis TaxID=2747483 RepID=A0A8X7BQ70_9ARAC|nr:hypothetical protein TNIN_277101 [Trichonephila inaurata madagascariensis]
MSKFSEKYLKKKNESLHENKLFFNASPIKNWPRVRASVNCLYFPKLDGKHPVDSPHLNYPMIQKTCQQQVRALQRGALYAFGKGVRSDRKWGILYRNKRFDRLDQRSRSNKNHRKVVFRKQEVYFVFRQLLDLTSQISGVRLFRVEISQTYHHG